MKNINTHTRSRLGFTLVELIAVMTVVAILAGVSMLPLLGLIEQARYKAERDTLAILANETRMSFRQEDFNLNISALKWDMPGTTLICGSAAAPAASEPTWFDNGMAMATETINDHAWYARLAKLRGQTITTTTLLREQKGDVQAIAYNAYHRRRIMLVGPYEKGQQRYIILSFMFNDGPAFPNTAEKRLTEDGSGNPTGVNSLYATWFDAIYNAEWGDKADSAPGVWTADQQAAWLDGYRGRNYMQRTIVQRIVQPRYTVTLNNNSHAYTKSVTPIPPATETTVTVYPDRAYIYANMHDWKSWSYSGLWARVDGRGHITPHPTLANTDSVQLFPARDEGILEGRRVLIMRDEGTETDYGNQAGAMQVESFLINQNTTYTAQ